MTTADYALIVSISSAFVALASLGWNVWSKFIYPKARVRVNFDVAVVIYGDGSPMPRFVRLSATNFGPTDVTLINAIVVISRGRFRRPQYGIANPVHSVAQPDLPMGPLAGGLPKKLAVGDEHTSFFPHESRSFGRADLLRIGFSDNFGRYHWCGKRQIRSVRIQLDKDFASEPYRPYSLVERE